jgi:hypothetical protein
MDIIRPKIDVLVDREVTHILDQIEAIEYSTTYGSASSTRNKYDKPLRDRWLFLFRYLCCQRYLIYLYSTKLVWFFKM